MHNHCAMQLLIISADDPQEEQNDAECNTYPIYKEGVLEKDNAEER